MIHVCDFFQGPKSDLQLPCVKTVLSFIAGSVLQVEFRSLRRSRKCDNLTYRATFVT